MCNSENLPKQWMGLLPNDPNNPTNKSGYANLPQGSPCRNCPTFAGLQWIKMASMRINCETANEIVDTLITFDANLKGGGAVANGQCFNIYNGYEFAGVRMTG